MTRSDIRFLLGFEPQSLQGFDPTTTVLNWLRDHEGRCGTKEGCAEGDCGACTVVLGKLEGDRIRYQAVNACILFLPQLDGAQLITVEHLKEQNGKLHPIQQALVDHHASQCGFCTPGFVMSLFAINLERDGTVDRQTVSDALSGNLCRCTGYRPIVDAAIDVMARGEEDRFKRDKKRAIAALRALDVDEPLRISIHGKGYTAPRNLAALADLIKDEPNAHLLAGGTDVGLWVTKQHRDLKMVIDVTRVTELKQIRETEKEFWLGAGVTYREAHSAMAKNWAAFGELIRRIGGMQVREAGTIGGNIANGSPIGDSMPALIALGAKLVLRKGRKTRAIALEDFYLDYRKTALDPGEFVSEVIIPKSSSTFRCYKISKRFDQDISAVLGAFHLENSADGVVQTIRIAFGGMAAIPKRAHRTEQLLLGQSWNIATIRAGQKALASDFDPLTDMRASANYRLKVAQNLLWKLYVETTEPTTKTSVLDLT